MAKDKIAYDIIVKGVEPMHEPLQKLEAMSHLLFGAGCGTYELHSDQMKGVGDILIDIHDEIKALCNKANAIHDSEGNGDKAVYLNTDPPRQP